MLNYQKIRLMTRASIYEEKESRGVFKINQYFRSDYVALGMIRSAIGISLGALLVLAVWAAIHMEELLTGTSLEALIETGRTFLFYYIVVLIFFEVITFTVYMVRYHKMEKGIHQYIAVLKKIEKMDSLDQKKGTNRREEF